MGVVSNKVVDYRPRGAAYDLMWAREPEILLEGPAGCLGGEARLWDPVAGRSRRIDELCQSGERPWVDTVDGPVRAEAPFVKGYAPLYRLTLENGASTVVTADHRVLSRSGWVCVGALEPGTELLSASREDAPRSSQRGEGSRSGYQKYRRSRDRRLLSESVAGLASAPSASDARGRSRAGSPAGAPASTEANTRTCPGSARLSTPGCSSQRRSAPSGAPQEGAVATLGARSRDLLDTFGHGAFQFLPRQRSLEASPRWSPSGQRDRDSERTPEAAAPSSVGSSCLESRGRWVPVQSIEYERTDFYYDLRVPGAAHYIADGIVGHNTGKTRALLEYVYWLCEEVPGIRVLLCRQTRASMTESVLVTWEDKVVPPNSPLLTGAQRRTRQSYDFPNGSHVVIGGLDNTDRIMSTEYDIIALFEATEASEESWEKLLTRLRNNVLNYQQGICDCNPAHFAHWLNRRADRPDATREGAPTMRRLLSRHEDNPSVTKEYLRTLDNLTGARYERLRLGLWVAEEGLVYPEWDPAKHVVPEHWMRNNDGTLKIRWYFGAIDWGYRAPGCLQVWGVDGERNMYRVSETYRVEKKIEWWADQVEKAHKRFNLRVLVCDSAEPENIEVMNERLGTPGKRGVGAKAIKADKSWVTGRDMVAELLKPSDGSDPRMYFINDGIAQGGGRDNSLAEARKPVCSEDEFLGYTWDVTKEGQPIKEAPQKDCDDHGLDCARYAAMYLWRNDHSRKDAEPLLRPGSIGDFLDWGEDLRGMNLA